MRRDRGSRPDLVAEPSASFMDAPAGAACARKKNSKASNALLRKGEYVRARGGGSTLLTRTLRYTRSLRDTHGSTCDRDVAVGQEAQTLLVESGEARSTKSGAGVAGVEGRAVRIPDPAKAQGEKKKSSLRWTKGQAQ